MQILILQYVLPWAEAGILDVETNEDIVNSLQKRFSPYCSVATWYLWRSIDPEPIQY